MDNPTLPSARVSRQQVRFSSVDGEVVYLDKFTEWPGWLVGETAAFAPAAISAGKEARSRATSGLLRIPASSHSSETWFGTGESP